MSAGYPGKLNRIERLLRTLTIVRAGEGRCVLLFSAHVFLMMAAYYLIKALRESFLLSESGAELRSYAVAANGLILMLLIPLYSALRRVVDNAPLVVTVMAFFAGNLLLFLLAYPLHAAWFGTAFFIWVGVFGLVVSAQFWALAASAFNTKSGQRLFPVIMLGASLGALTGAEVTDLLIDRFGAAPLLALGGVVLAVSAAIVFPAMRAIPPASASTIDSTGLRHTTSIAGGFRVVFSDRYLMLVALFVVLLNCIVSTGDFLLASLVQQRANALGAVATLAREAYIGSFYARYHFWVTLIGVLLQMFVVSRVYRAIGVRGALLVLPVIALFVYGGIAFVPIFSVVWLAKVLEASTNFSLMTTTQQALYLPTSPLAKYDGKMTIDTFFWRFGDVVQAGLVYVGLRVFDFTTTQFALLNTLLTAAWVVLAFAIGLRYVSLVRTEVANTAPVRVHELANVPWRSGQVLAHELDADAFYDADPGDVLRFAACQEDGSPLPEWLNFDEQCGSFSGIPPDHAPEQLVIEVTAIDFDGARASGSVVLFRSNDVRS